MRNNIDLIQSIVDISTTIIGISKKITVMLTKNQNRENKMTVKRLVILLTALTIIAAVSCKNKEAESGKIFKTVSVESDLIEDPSELKPKKVTNGKVNRGEYLILEEEGVFDNKTYFKVTIVDTKTNGWISSANVKDGKLKSITVIQDEVMYTRPNIKSDKAGTIKAGQVVFKLEESGEFALIQISGGKEAYIPKSSLGDAEDVVKTVSIPGLGKAVVTASSQKIPSEGKETWYDPRNAFDGNKDTSWGEGKTGGDGVGESITLTFENPVSISSISLINGYTHSKNEEYYTKSSRIASLKITSDTGGSVVLDFEDDIRDYQTRDCEPNISGRSFTFMINGVYKGPWNSCYISELKITGEIVKGEYGNDD